MTNNYVCHIPYLRKHASYDCEFWYTYVKGDISRCFFHCFKILIFPVVRGGGGIKAKNGPKWQETPSLLLHISSNFFHFFKILIFLVFKGRVKGKKWPILTNFSLSHFIFQELYIISWRLLVHRYKIMISLVFLDWFFLIFVNIKVLNFFWPTSTVFLNKKLFFRFISKYQTEILWCAQPSSHVSFFQN